MQNRLTFFCIFMALVFSTGLQAQSLKQRLDQKKQAGQKKGDPKKIEIVTQAIKKLRETGITEKMLKTGKMAPEVEFKNRKGQKISLKELYQKGPVVLTFYRGGWCPYCVLELKEYQKLYEEFKAAGAEVIALSPESKLEVAKTKKKNNLSFHVYSDDKNAIAKKFGVAFKLSEQLREVYNSYGIDLAKSQGNKLFELPMPGTYVIDKKGKIIFAFADPDYTQRAEPTEVLDIVKRQ